MLARAGWDALARNQPGEAANAFREAIARDPRNANLHFGAGTAAFLERRDQDARAALERALGLDPTLASAREILGLALYRSGDVLAAVRAYERLPNTPEYEQARLRLERWRREADLHGRMTSVAGAWFTVSFEGEADAELAARALASIERAADRIGLSCPRIRPNRSRSCSTRAEQFRDITRAPIGAGGAYDGTVRVPMRGALANPRNWTACSRTITHAIVHSLAPRNVPAWLHEGLADGTRNRPQSGERRQPASHSLPASSPHCKPHSAGSLASRPGSPTRRALAPLADSWTRPGILRSRTSSVIWDRASISMRRFCIGFSGRSRH